MRVRRRRETVRRVVVATDGSDSAARAVDWAAELAERYEAELVLLRVVAGDPGPAGAELEREAARLGARARVEVAEEPAEAIVRAAAEQKADVLVVGNVGMTGRREFLLGNVPNRVSHNAPCTVVIVATRSRR
jgi:ubiquinone biosynthesis protein